MVDKAALVAVVLLSVVLIADAATRNSKVHVARLQRTAAHAPTIDTQGFQKLLVLASFQARFYENTARWNELMDRLMGEVKMAIVLVLSDPNSDDRSLIADEGLVNKLLLEIRLPRSHFITKSSFSNEEGVSTLKGVVNFLTSKLNLPVFVSDIVEIPENVVAIRVPQVPLLTQYGEDILRATLLETITHPLNHILPSHKTSLLPFFRQSQVNQGQQANQAPQASRGQSQRTKSQLPSGSGGK